MPRRTPYTDAIRSTLARIGFIGTDPRHVEAWMRIEHGTLDALGPDRFAAEVETAVACIRDAGAAQSEALAQSYGL